MKQVIEIWDMRTQRTVYPTRRSSSSLQPSWSSSYAAAVRLDPDEIEEEVQFWRGLINDPDVWISAVE